MTKLWLKTLFLTRFRLVPVYNVILVTIFQNHLSNNISNLYKAALFIVAIWDIFSFFTIPITCALVYKLSFTNNLKANLMGEVLIINVSYLLEDGVELMMQYYYFDKYAGVRYDYFETDGIVNIFFSAMISFTLAVFNIFALSHLFVQDQIVSIKNECLSLELN